MVTSLASILQHGHKHVNNDRRCSRFIFLCFPYHSTHTDRLITNMQGNRAPRKLSTLCVCWRSKRFICSWKHHPPPCASLFSCRIAVSCAFFCSSARVFASSAFLLSCSRSMVNSSCWATSTCWATSANCTTCCDGSSHCYATSTGVSRGACHPPNF